MLEALFALCRKAVENEPLKIFMAMSDIDRNRAEAARSRRRWTAWPATIGSYGAQYRHLQRSRRSLERQNDHPVPGHGARRLNKLRDPLFRSDTAGTFQALVGSWQIFVRPGHASPHAKADAAFCRHHQARLRQVKQRSRTVRRRPQRRARSCWQPTPSTGKRLAAAGAD